MQHLLEANRQTRYQFEESSLAIFRHFGIEPVAGWRGIVWDWTDRNWEIENNILKCEHGRLYVHEVRFKDGFALAYFDHGYLLDVKKEAKGQFPDGGLKVQDGGLLKPITPFKASSGFVTLPDGTVVGFSHDENQTRFEA